MENIFTKLKEKYDQKKLDVELLKLKLTHDIEILDQGFWHNNRFEYAEIFGGGFQANNDNLRYGSMGLNTYFTISLEEDMQVKSTLGEYNCDAIIRRINPFPANHLYFHKGKFTGLLRKFTPSMSGGKPRDYIIHDLHKVNSQINAAKPLFKALELKFNKTYFNEVK